MPALCTVTLTDDAKCGAPADQYSDGEIRSCCYCGQYTCRLHFEQSTPQESVVEMRRQLRLYGSITVCTKCGASELLTAVSQRLERLASNLSDGKFTQSLAELRPLSNELSIALAALAAKTSRIVVPVRVDQAETAGPRVPDRALER